MAETELLPWNERNDTLRVFKISGKFGWLHLVVAQDKKSGRKFLRLKRYRNWFSIPDSQYLSRVQTMLHKGAAELQWEPCEDLEIKVEEVKKAEEIEELIKQDNDLLEGCRKRYSEYLKVIEK